MKESTYEFHYVRMKATKMDPELDCSCYMGVKIYSFVLWGSILEAFFHESDMDRNAQIDNLTTSFDLHSMGIMKEYFIACEEKVLIDIQKLKVIDWYVCEWSVSANISFVETLSTPDILNVTDG